MANLVTRAGKGAPLTFGEVDANFSALNAEVAAVSETVQSAASSSAPGSLVIRDGNGGFSAGTITVDGNFSVGGATTLGAASATTPSTDSNSTALATTAWVRTLQEGKVGTNRQVLAGTGLTGGGNLTADRTLAVAFASQLEAEGGVAAEVVMSPLRTAQQISGLAPKESPVFSGTATFLGDVLLSGTGYLDLPAGTTAQRPASPNSGMIRFNTDLGQFEGYSGTIWSSVGGGATGGGSDTVFLENSNTVTTNYTLSTGKNAVSAGPVTVNAGVTVTVPSGASWVIV